MHKTQTPISSATHDTVPRISIFGLWQQHAELCGYNIHLHTTERFNFMAGAAAAPSSWPNAGCTHVEIGPDEQPGSSSVTPAEHMERRWQSLADSLPSDWRADKDTLSLAHHVFMVGWQAGRENLRDSIERHWNSAR